ncbi:MAG: hypothetical protein KA974_01845 [Saprospiraceae bacterium]|nr:hypothetical protein [Saprospiraceae bacterium]MBP7680147.1 hypothetical protein [Saprospiraceae bacterium]
MPLRESFPNAGEAYLDVVSEDGWEYRIAFAGSRLADSFDMVRHFLHEEGYGDIPLPASAADLRLFRRHRQPQMLLFNDNGYVHNPIKILFSDDTRKRNMLILCIYNDAAPQHLLKFHGVLPITQSTESHEATHP